MLKFFIKQRKHKYVNGVKGAISLFLVMILAPFLMCITVIVDTARIYSSKTTIQQVMGIAGLSTLGNYDAYLQQRFGLYAVDQEKNIQEIVSSYVNTNKKLAADVNISGLTAKGEYSLVDNEILYNQVMEYCKLNAPTELVKDLSQIEEFIKDLENKLGILKNIVKMLTSTCNMIGATKDFVDAEIGLKNSAQSLKASIDGYQSAYTECAGKLEMAYNSIQQVMARYQEWQNATQDLMQKEYLLNAAIAQQSPNVDIYINHVNNAKAKVNQALTRLNLARDSYRAIRAEYDNAKINYSMKINELITQLNAYETAHNNCCTKYSKLKQAELDMTSSLGGVILDTTSKKKEKEAKEAERKELLDQQAAGSSEGQEKIDELTAQINQLDNEIAAAKTGNAYVGAVTGGVKNMVSGTEETLNKCSSDTLAGIRDQLGSLQMGCPNLPAAESITNTSVIYMNEVPFYSITDSMYVTGNDVDVMMDNQFKQIATDTLITFLESIAAFFESIFKVKLFNDGQLNAVIDINFYNSEFGGLSGGVVSGNTTIEKIIKDIEDIAEYGNKVSNALHGNFMELLNILDSIMKLIDSVKQFINHVCTFVEEVKGNVGELLTGQLYTSFYMSKNLPCRTNYDSGSTMTLYPFSKIGLPDSGRPDLSLLSDIAALFEMLTGMDQGAPDKYTFCGAELEYILHGSHNETKNQLYVFFELYLVRLLLNIGPILSNPEVEMMAAATTIGYPVVLLLEIIFEPLCDMILLVNGSDVPIWPTTIYLTPSGIPQFLGEISSIAMTSEQKNKLKEDLGNKFKFKEGDYSSGGGSSLVKKLFSYKYEEYCFFLLFLTTPKTIQINRFKQLVWMETYNHYKGTRKFDLRKSYTYLDIKCDMSMSGRMQNILSSNLFRTTVHEYRGY